MRGIVLVRTHHNRRDLRNLAHVVVGLHDALYPRNGEVVLDDNVVDIRGQRRARALAIVGCQLHWRRVHHGHIVAILHALLLAYTAAGH